MRECFHAIQSHEAVGRTDPQLVDFSQLPLHIWQELLASPGPGEFQSCTTEIYLHILMRAWPITSARTRVCIARDATTRASKTRFHS